MKEISQQVKDKLTEAVKIWADENLQGKPALLATSIYFALLQELENKALEIESTFKK